MSRTRAFGWLAASVLVASLSLAYSAGAIDGVVVRVSQLSNGADANSSSDQAAISADGRFVAFASVASNLVADDANGLSDVFVWDGHSGVLERISVSSNGIEGDGNSFAPSVSASGRFVAFQSDATNLVADDTNAARDIFVHDMVTGTTRRESLANDGSQAAGGSYVPVISADGRFLAFSSGATNLVASDTNGVRDVFVRDTLEETTVRVSVDSNGVQGNELSWDASLSADGSRVAFSSDATNLVAGDTNGLREIFLHNLSTSETSRVSVANNGSQGDGRSINPSISADGHLVAFRSDATNLVPDDTNGFGDVFVRNLTTGQTTLVSVAADGGAADGTSGEPVITGNGRFVAFSSGATNLVDSDSNGFGDVFVRDLTNATTVRVSVADDGTEAVGDSQEAVISDDARIVAFRSSAPNLVPGDTNGFVDVFRVTADVPPSEDPFADDDESIFESDIEALARAGITRGCNPPDNTLFCPSDPVTRGQMAAFLVRALGYVDDGAGDLFVDDDASVFEGDIDRLGTAGVTKGCDPPDNTLFCPSDPVTRGQMAAFLVRALGYVDDGAGDLFVDDDASVFEGDIDRLGTAGVTRGCNPPENTLFCPSDPVTRGQMAAFLVRALDLD